MDTPVRHNEAAHRFEAGAAAQPAHLDYRLREGVVELVHTEVPGEYQGQGLAGKLAAAALDWARAAGRKVVPSCSYIKTYLGKHPEYADLI
ncbi:MAG: GNAT family N-acetyltransferase [Acidobacteriota bacterium]